MLKKFAQFCGRAAVVILVITISVGIFAAAVGLVFKLHQSVHDCAR